VTVLLRPITVFRSRGFSSSGKVRLGEINKIMAEDNQSNKKIMKKDESTSVDDRELVKRALNKDRDAYRLLVEKYQNSAFSLAYRILQNREDAEDVVQESFVKAYISLANFRLESTFYTWLYQIVRNMAIDVKRRSKRQYSKEVDKGDTNYETLRAEESMLAQPSSSPDYDLERKEKVSRINQALEGISEEHRTVIMLREVEGLDYQEIADVTGVSKGTVMSRLHYARKKLQQTLRNFIQDFGLNTKSSF
jgi:RNA polymerase sigma-70 factor, ECF subfamily